MREPDGPRRWLDSGSELPPKLRGVVQRAAADYDVAPGRVSAMDKQLRRLFEEGAGGGGASGGYGGGLPWKLPVVGLTTLMLAGAAFYLLRSPAPKTAPAPPVPPAPAHLTAAPAPARAAPAPAAAFDMSVPSAQQLAPAVVARPAQPRATAVRRAARQPADTLAQEVRLIAAAQRRLQTNPARALTLTERHRARFPRGVLLQEREALAIEALLRLVRAPEARRRAEALFHRAPRTSYRLRIDALLKRFAPPEVEGEQVGKY